MFNSHITIYRKINEIKKWEKNKNIKINVPIPFGKPLINKSEIELIKKQLIQNILVHGPKSIEFEKKFRNFTKSKYAISVSNCTTE